MEIEAQPEANGVAVIRLTGRLDLVSAEAVKRAFQEQIDAGHRTLIVDLSGVGFVDSSGLGALVSGLKVARQQSGDLRLVGLGAQARQLFQITSLDRVFHAYDSVEAARGKL